ncbi:glycoside hydrolase superfamily [Pelagophyceae sp. CCMP2097]|nr:glycoside hydrolase superfamily [Pelagophyceae sp. CCMP2097]
MLALLVLALAAGRGASNENGLARTPPMGWRSWNLYGGGVDQELIERVMDGMVSRRRLVDGAPTSLCDLGYCDVALDDGWQLCDSVAGAPARYHDETGAPLVNTQRFPSLRNMTGKAHSLGLKAGWYGNNCICADDATGDSKYYAGDVAAVVDYGFDSLKMDGCGAQLDLQLYDDLFRSNSPRPISVENCHWGSKKPFAPNATWCPWNTYRTSGDVQATFGSVLKNLASVEFYAAANLSRPGCWAYADMLEVGCSHGPHGDADSGLSPAEARTHFGAWAIVSSPLTLSHDVWNETVMDAIWPVISNREAIAVNQAYVGHSGALFHTSGSAAHDFADAATGQIERVETPAQLFYAKPLGAGRTALLLVNAGDVAADLAVDFAAVPGADCAAGCAVRNVWAHADVGRAETAFTRSVAPHDSAFLIISAPA